MIVISSREFRQNQKDYFEKVDNGEQIIVQRGKDRAYAITPVSENDIYFNSQMISRITESIKQIKEGKSKSVSNTDELNELLGL